jgi:hypothetical protein
VAQDSAGLIYVLDSESSFRFLARQHPPRGLDSSNAVTFVQTALRMQGKLPRGARLLTDRPQAPEGLCRKTGIVCGGLFLTHAERGGRTVFLTAYTDVAIYSAGPITVDLTTGYVTAAVEVHYDSTALIH